MRLTQAIETFKTKKQSQITMEINKKERYIEKPEYKICNVCKCSENYGTITKYIRTNDMNEPGRDIELCTCAPLYLGVYFFTCLR